MLSVEFSPLGLDTIYDEGGFLASGNGHLLTTQNIGCLLDVPCLSLTLSLTCEHRYLDDLKPAAHEKNVLHIIYRPCFCFQDNGSLHHHWRDKREFKGQSWVLLQLPFAHGLFLQQLGWCRHFKTCKTQGQFIFFCNRIIISSKKHIRQ